MIKELHVSKNKFNINAYVSPIQVTGDTASGLASYFVAQEISVPVELIGQTLTFSVTLSYNSSTWCRAQIVDGETTVNGTQVYTRGNSTVTFTATATSKIHIQVNGSDALNMTLTNPMLNTGQTALPYEPYGDTWNTKSYAKIVDTTQQVTSFPVVVRPMENVIPSWTIKGSMVQSGTPTPQNPITPSETGDRTANLFDDETASGYYNDSGTLVQDGGTSHSTTYIPVNGTTYTVSGLWNTGGQMSNFAVYEWDNNKNWLRRSNRQYPPSSNEITFTIGTDAAYITLQVQTEHGNIMLNTGSQPLPYQPYGYVLPIKSANTTTPVYLGEVQSTRNVKKLVLTGQEECYQYDFQNTKGVGVYNMLDTSYSRATGLCSHYPVSKTQTLNSLWIGVNNTALYFVGIMDVLGISTVAAFKTFLQQQYAAGTPVCVWYVLATETTTTLNEPLRKIGTYSDSVSGTNLSVTAQSPTTIDVDTSLKPSEMDLTYTGKKMCGRKKCASLLADNPLCGIGTYKDTLDLETGTLTRKIQKIVLDGTENWSPYSASRTAQVMTLSPPTQGVSMPAHEICSHLPWSVLIIAQSADGFLIGSNSQLVLDRADGTDIPTWLASEYANGTPVTIWYALTTATTETIPVPIGLTGTVEGYLNRSGTPTPTNPIYPTANDVPLWR